MRGRRGFSQALLSQSLATVLNGSKGVKEQLK